MNGVHDLGGMHGMGPIPHEEDEPVFHAPWEGRVYAMNRALGAFRKWNLDAWRHDIELLPPHEYLRLSYYEKWLAAMENRVLKYGLVSEEERRSGKATPGAPRATPALTLESSSRWLSRSIPSSRDPSVPALFSVGQRVRAKNLHPAGHTRLPRYARGKSGIIDRDHGVYVFPDTNAQFQGESRQHVYSVRFEARELWGEAASARDSVYVDLWDDYLERVP
jgi:nitrile hydratase